MYGFRSRLWGRPYSFNDRYEPPEFREGDRVRFRRCRVPNQGSGDSPVVWEVIEVGVKRPSDWRKWVRVRSERSGLTRAANPTHLEMFESAAERVAKALMGEEGA